MGTALKAVHRSYMYVRAPSCVRLEMEMASQQLSQPCSASLQHRQRSCMCLAECLARSTDGRIRWVVGLGA